VTDQPEHPADSKPIDPAAPTEADAPDPKVIKSSTWKAETTVEEAKPDRADG
jgi:hypothetical protein